MTVKRLLLAVFTAALVFAASGCSTESTGELQASVSVTPAQEAVLPPATPTPEPTPTPVVDIPRDRYDALETPRAERFDKEPLSVSCAGLTGNFSPFFVSDEGDALVTDKTQITLMSPGETAEQSAGVDKACLAYEIALASDEEIAGVGLECPESYIPYRITLKKGICFSDGLPVTVSDFLFSLYLICDPLYDGLYDISQLNIPGMREYHTQVPEDVRIETEKAVAAGINADGSFPEAEGVSAKMQQAVYSCIDEAGIRFAQGIIDYVNENYAKDTYVQAFMSEKLTYDLVASDDSLRTAYAYVVLGYAAMNGNAYDAGKEIFYDYLGREYRLSEKSLTAEDLWNAFVEYYGGYDLSDSGINYEGFEGVTVQDYLAECYYDTLENTVESISGIACGSVTDEDGAERDCIYLLLDKDTDIRDFNFYIASREYYSALYDGECDEHGVAVGNSDFMKAVKAMSVHPYGAGEYIFESFDGSRAVLTANESFMTGSPEYRTVEIINDDGEDF